MLEEATILEKMKKLGFSEYEVKAYFSLLKDYPVNGYALSKNSGIPRSRIYEVLDNLKNRQIVFEEKGEKSTLYYPLEPELLVSKIRKDFQGMIEEIDEYANMIYYRKEEDNKLSFVKGRNNILEFINLLISQGEKRISLFVWQEELEELKEGIDNALARGVVLNGILFGYDNPYSQLCSHRRIEQYLAEKNERDLIVTIDSSQVIFGVVSRGENSQVTWTKDKAFVQMSDDYIVHDISLNKLMDVLDEKTREKWETFLDNFRKEYYGSK